MKSLLILRHAEAAPASANLPDGQRPLTAAGRAQAQRMGASLRERALEFQHLLCSAALRARETAEGVVPASGFRVPLDLREQLYNASGEEMFAQLKGVQGDPARVLLVGHMPGVAELADLLVTDRGGVSLIFSPCTLAELALEVKRWADLKPGCGALRLLLPP